LELTGKEKFWFRRFSNMNLLKNRVEAGKRLAEALKEVSNNAIVLAVPRGGVVVGYEVAKALHVPLDVVIAKKIGAPGNPELAIGAVAEDGTLLLDANTVDMLNVSQAYIRDEVENQKAEIKRRLQRYRGDAPPPQVLNREVIVVDDGVATGATLKATLRSLRKRGAKPLVVAVPVGPKDTVAALKTEADRVVCLHTPELFYAIGEFYEDFDQTADQEVIELLEKSRQEMQAGM
jgi:predicted phosphoribosyltransferase